MTGSPFPLQQQVRVSNLSGWTQYAISENGSLIYDPGTAANQEYSLVWVDRSGATQLVTELRRDYEEPQFSPDGSRLALTIWESGNRDIWIFDINRGILTPFTFGDGESARARWTPDGKRLAFTSTREGTFDLYWKPADGSGEVEILLTSDRNKTPTSWSPQGVLAYSEGNLAARDIWVFSLEGEGTPMEFLARRFHERNPVFSPDGQWIALTSNQSGQDEIYVKSYSDEGGMVQISIEGGQEPIWAPDGNELFYRNGDQMMVVPLRTKPTFEVQTPRLLFEGSYRYERLGLVSNYDISPDGQRFLMIQQKETTSQTQINVVLNWFEELNARVPVP